MGRTIALLAALLTACGGSPSVLVKSDVDGLDGVAVAVEDAHGVVVRADHLPASGALKLPARLELDLSGRTDSLELLVWGLRDGAKVAFADLALEPGSSNWTVTLAAPGPDADGDSIPDRLDRCVYAEDPDQRDADGDGSGDACGCRQNRLFPFAFASAADLAAWNRDNSTATLVTASGQPAVKVCPQGSGTFGLNRTFAAPSGVQVKLSALLATDDGLKAAPLIYTPGCDSWGACNTGGLTGPDQLGPTFRVLETQARLTNPAAFDVEVTAEPPGCVLIARVCAEFIGP